MMERPEGHAVECTSHRYETELRSRLARASEQVAELQDALAVAHREVQELESARTEIHRLQEEHSKLLGQLDAMLHSTSWRVTQPLRKLRGGS